MSSGPDMFMPMPDADVLQTVARSAIERLDIDSAAVFVLRPNSTGLELVAATGIAGQALDRLAEAVRHPAHPIPRTLVDATPSFDVTPVAPGGPALRSHLPLLVDRGDQPVAVGVLAVAHAHRLEAPARQMLVELADRAAATIDRSGPLGEVVDQPPGFRST